MNKRCSTIMHVDINSYFATLLQQENPHLRGKPVGVIKAPGRTCLIAVSKEAKARGIKTAARLAEAQQKVPDLITVPASFERYLDATKRLKKVFSTIAPTVFIYSLDEAFIDISDCLTHLYTSPEMAGRLAQERIKQELGAWVTSNVGISHNRFLAKMASETAPKGGFRYIDHENKDLLLAETSFDDVCGIGSSLSKKLANLGVSVPYQIRFFSQEQLEAVFGPFWSKELLKMAYGEEPHHLKLLDRTLPHMKSVGRSITGYHLYDDEAAIRQILLNLTEEVTYKVRKMGLAGRQISISLYGQNQAWREFVTLQRYVRHTEDMFAILYDQLYGNWQRCFKVIRFAVRLSLLKPEWQTPQPLSPTYQRRRAITQARDEISKTYGLFTLHSARLLNQHKRFIRPEVTGFLGDREFYGL